MSKKTHESAGICTRDLLFTSQAYLLVLLPLHYPAIIICLVFSCSTPQVGSAFFASLSINYWQLCVWRWIKQVLQVVDPWNSTLTRVKRYYGGVGCKLQDLQSVLHLVVVSIVPINYKVTYVTTQESIITCSASDTSGLVIPKNWFNFSFCVIMFMWSCPRWSRDNRSHWSGLLDVFTTRTKKHYMNLSTSLHTFNC